MSVIGFESPYTVADPARGLGGGGGGSSGSKEPPFANSKNGCGLGVFRGILMKRSESAGSASATTQNLLPLCLLMARM